MKTRNRFVLVLMTAPDLRTARRLARSALKQRLIACANLIPKVESHYWWREKLETGAEVFMLLKTTTRRLTALERLVVAEHPYDTPEFIVLRLQQGNRQYLDWWGRCVR